MIKLRDPVLVLRYAFLIAAAVLFLTPYVWMLSQSLKSLAEYYTYPPQIIPPHPRWENYQEVVTSFPIGTAILNSFIVAAATSILQVLTSALAGFAFAVLRFRGSQVAFTILLTQLMFPLGVILIPLFRIVQEMGGLNTYWGLVLPFGFTAFGMFLMTQYFRGIPRDLFEAAQIDGASLFTTWWKVYLPLSVPGLAALGALAFVYYWNSLLWPLLMTTERSKQVLPVFIAQFSGLASSFPHLTMAAAAIAVLAPLVIFLAVQRYFISGLVAGSVK